MLMLSFITAILLFFSLPLAAWTAPECGHLAFASELLYFAPSYDETYFVINGSGSDGLMNPTPNGKRINNPVGYNFGFRLEGMYNIWCSCVDFRLRWTHVYATSKERVSNPCTVPQLWPTEQIPSLANVPSPFRGNARSKIGVMHQKGEALFDEKMGTVYCFYLTLRQGIEWSYIRYHEVIQYTHIDDDGDVLTETTQYHGHTKGLGPQFGIIILCDPFNYLNWGPRDLSFRFLTSATLIAANSKAKVKTQDMFSTEENKILASSFWRFVPEWVLSFGINYSKCICDYLISAEIGYEITTYLRGSSKVVFEDTSKPGLSFNQYSDFYVHGIFFNLGVAY